MGRWFPRPISRNQQHVVIQTQLGGFVSLERLEVDNEIVLDGEDRVALKIWVVVGKDLIGNGLVVVVADLRMGVSSAKAGIRAVAKMTASTCSRGCLP